MEENQIKFYSIDEYLVLEETASEKHEYNHGIVTAMSGGTINHGIIGNNINAALNLAIKEKGLGCTSINGDVKVWIDKAESFVYPDAMVICGEIITADVDIHSVINPVLIVEVLSKSTESYDRGDKFHKYCSLSSFQEYILIDLQKPVIDILYKVEIGSWKIHTKMGLNESIYLNTLKSAIPIEDIYRNTVDLNPPQFKLD